MNYDPIKGKYPELYVSFDNTKATATNPVVTCLLTQEAAGTCKIDSTFHHDVLNDPLTTPLQNGNRAQYGLQVSGGVGYASSSSSRAIRSTSRNPYKMPGIEISRLTAERRNVDRRRSDLIELAQGRELPHEPEYPAVLEG